jgi:hypothetical protein
VGIEPEEVLEEYGIPAKRGIEEANVEATFQGKKEEGHRENRRT